MATINAINIPTGISNTMLQGQGIGIAPAFSTASYPATAGTAGKILISDGTNIVSSTPTYPNTSGSAGVILRSDGTNNVYSTATYPNTAGTSGNYLTSDGTNFVSRAPLVYSVTIPLTNANIKALNTTPITILAAQGAGEVIIPITAVLKLIYGGSNVFSSSGVSTCICYGSVSNTNIIFKSNTASFWATAATEYFIPLNSTASSTFNFSTATAENAVVSVSTSAAITGNVANDNTGEVNMVYYLLSI